jgi:hypothetical protein
MVEQYQNPGSMVEQYQNPGSMVKQYQNKAASNVMTTCMLANTPCFTQTAKPIKLVA